MKKQFIFLFLLLQSFFVFSNDFSFTQNHIYSDQTGTSHLFNANVNFIIPMNTFSNTTLFFDTNLNFLNSSLPFFSSQITNLNFNCGFNNNYFGINTTFGLLFSDKINSKIPKKRTSMKIQTDGIQLLYGGISIPFKINDFSFSPTFLCFDFSISSTNFDYLFYARGKSNFGLLYGISGNHKNHKIDFFGFNTKISIDDLENTNLFASNTNLFLVNYSQNWKTEITSKNKITSFSFTPFLGYLFTRENFAGRLPMETVKSWYYPYEFFNIDFDFSGNILFTGLIGKIEHQKIEFNYSLTVFHIFQQKTSFTQNTKKLENAPSWQEALIKDKKNNFTESYDYLDNFGLILSNFELIFNITNKTQMNLSKIFVIPYKFPTNNDFSNKNNQISLQKKDAINYLLSGISIGFEIEL